MTITTLLVILIGLVVALCAIGAAALGLLSQIADDLQALRKDATQVHATLDSVTQGGNSLRTTPFPTLDPH